MRRSSADLLRKHWPVLLLLGAWIVLAATLADDFGQSWDDSTDAGFGRSTLAAYTGSRDFMKYGDLVYYGPFHFMLSALATPLLLKLRPAWLAVDARHFMNAATFLLAVASVYVLSRRLSGRWAATLAAVLFASQPVFFGHAFINQKDTPFLGMFAVSVTLGLAMVDRWSHSSAERASRNGGLARRIYSQEWRNAGRLRRMTALAVVGLGLVSSCC